MQFQTAVNPYPIFTARKARKGLTMNTDKTTTAKAEQPHFEKRIGKTTYRVKVHFNPNSKETITDKIMRLLRNDAQNPKL